MTHTTSQPNSANGASKPRLKFSTVRDSLTSSSAHNPPVYSMPITRDYSIDEKTNRIVNEFLMYDPSLDENRSNTLGELSTRNTSNKRHHHPHHSRVRAKTFDEPLPNQQQNHLSSHSTPGQKQVPARAASHKQRFYSSLLNNTRKHSQQHPLIHLTDNMEHVEADNSNPSTNLSSLLSHASPSNTTSAPVRRQNSIATASPSIIITGDDSGSWRDIEKRRSWTMVWSCDIILSLYFVYIDCIMLCLFL